MLARSSIYTNHHDEKCDCVTQYFDHRRPGEKGAGGVREAGEEGREAGFPRWQEAGEKRKNYATLRNICNRKNAKRREPTNIGRELGLKGMGSERFKPPCPPPPLVLKKGL